MNLIKMIHNGRNYGLVCNLGKPMAVLLDMPERASNNLN
jgi:6-phosphogluconate dehydrogenase (decarboxylating)